MPDLSGRSHTNHVEIEGGESPTEDCKAILGHRVKRLRLQGRDCRSHFANTAEGPVIEGRHIDGM